MSAVRERERGHTATISCPAILSNLVSVTMPSVGSGGRGKRYRSCERLPPAPLPDQLVILTTPLGLADIAANAVECDASYLRLREVKEAMKPPPAVGSQALSQLNESSCALAHA
jgi:hypothetical protein